MNRKLVGVGVGSALIAIIVWTVFLMTFTPHLVSLYGTVGVDLEAKSIHATVTFYKDGEFYAQFYHAGAVTDIGDNTTLYWIFGDSDYWPPSGNYDSNTTWISIGNQGTLDTTSTQLPGEWNRTTATIEDEVQSQLNLTATFYPDAAGPYTADCIGLNWASSGDNNLWGYDTFTEVTGIDETFTINVEFQVSVSHS